MSPKLLFTARCFFALSLIVFGVQQFALGKLVAGRPSVLASLISGEDVVAYIVGVLLVLTGLLVLVGRFYQYGLIGVGSWLLGAAALPNLVQTIAKADYGALLTCTGKALTLGSGAFLVLASFYKGAAPLVGAKPAVDAPLPVATRTLAGAPAFFLRLGVLCRFCFGLFLLASGIQHFLFVDFVKALIPAWIPGDVFWVYASGVFLIVAGGCFLAGWQLNRVGKTVAAVILGWFLILHLPRAIGPDGNANEWTASFEALAFSGLAYLLSVPAFYVMSQPRI
ncbi:hypothetical protein [Paraflavitalea sp. CAU 1676]|uniref:hypothetical protein n=1 Tax=Paraflavitalea sp. CAU 1676 TaxID=3032598 RepID=UPI0023D9B4FB|nr:hypothetical protein [Paraflavitalea sp. CAU 1676]MDF2192720.1 hypothetical protein [Paraflavitalea sp. CAU 1676]